MNIPCDLLCTWIPYLFVLRNHTLFLGYLMTPQRKSPQDVFGEDVFGENQMRDKLPPHTWETFKKCVETDEHLDVKVADQVT